MAWLFPADAWAHGPVGHLPKESSAAWWQAWSWSPLILGSLLLVSTAYATGWARRRARRESSAAERKGAAAFAAGVGTLFVALISPLAALSEQLNSVHMVQHTLIMMVAAPLFALASPGYLSLWAVPPGAWKRLGRFRRWLAALLRASRFSRPIAIAVLYAATLWLWHLPSLYEAALARPLIHDLQHLSFFLASYLFWRVLFDPFGRRNLNAGAGMLYLFATSMHAMILGVLMALSPRAWYPHYVEPAARHGLSALQDQQLAGYIMWMPAGTTYLVAAIILVARLFSEPKTRREMADRRDAR